VQVPGRYPLLEREERLSSLVARAGGLTDEAHVDGSHLLRDSTLVGIDLARVLANPGGEGDVVLRPDDQLVVPDYDGTVLVLGAVAFETRVIYDPDLDFGDYLERAGGASAEADLGRASILYANGSRATVNRRLLFFTSRPDVEAGSTIYVPFAPEDAGTDWNAVVTRGLGILGSIATLVVAVTR
jgi:protein involved in polysaccharide export with SLBB domain